MKEIWKPIKNYENLYEVSNLGRVKSIKRNLILKSAINTRGYLHIVLSNKNRVDVRVHRIVAQAFIPNPNNLPQVNHKDGNKLNNCVDNLEWCTNLENHNHAIGLGLKSIKLNKRAIEYIRKHYVPYDKEFGQRALARKFKVGHKSIARVI